MATDLSGNTSTDTQIIAVQYTTKPVVIQNAGDLDRVLKCSDTQDISDALALVPSATDNCSPSANINLVSDNTISAGNCDYVRVRKWNFIDDCGNVSLDFIQTITIENDQVPAPLIVFANDDKANIDGSNNRVKGVINILTNDFVDTVGNVTVKVIKPAATGNLLLNPEGFVDLKTGTPAGNYAFVYEICSVNSPEVYSQATLRVTVVAPSIVTNNDDFSAKPINSSKGAVLDILAKDKINDQSFDSFQVTTTILDSNGLIGVTLDSQGKLVIPIGAP
jgi:hypothetical protein